MSNAQRNLIVLCAIVLLAGPAYGQPAPNRALLQADQGVSALLRGQYDKAIEAYSRALEAPDISDVRRANIYNDRGVAKWRLGRPKDAIADFNQAIGLFPDYAVVYNNRGNALMDLERPDEAVKDFNRAIDLAPAYGAAHNNRGNALLAMGSEDAALKAYAKAVELMPNNAVPLNGRGNVSNELERPFAAMRDLNRAILLNAKYGNAYRNRARAMAALERHTNAVKDLTRAITNANKNTALYLARARAYMQLKRYRPAINDFTKVIQLEPESPEAYGERGLAYAKLNSFAKAQKDFAKAIALAPNVTTAYVNRATTYARMGTPQEGLADANRALAISPNSAQAYQARAEIYEKLGRNGEADADHAKAAELKSSSAGDALRGEALPWAPGEVVGPPFEDWLIRREPNRSFVATNPHYPELHAPLEMYGKGEPAILGWEIKKNTLRGIGLLRYFAGTAADGGRAEYVAIIDLWKNTVVAIEPFSLGGRAAKWAWADVAVVVTDLQGTPSEVQLRRARQPQVDKNGNSIFDDWLYGEPTPEPRRRAPSRGGLFNWLFGD